MKIQMISNQESYRIKRKLHVKGQEFLALPIELWPIRGEQKEGIDCLPDYITSPSISNLNVTSEKADSPVKDLCHINIEHFKNDEN